jgi:RNA polymerase sigma-70 factor (family 1)
MAAFDCCKNRAAIIRGAKFSFGTNTIADFSDYFYLPGVLFLIKIRSLLPMAGSHQNFLYDENSFKDLFDTYFDRVHDYISAISRSDYIAEEVTQELFVILWRKRGDLHAVQQMDQYIFRIARNLAITLLKKAAMDSKLATQFYRQSLKQTNEVLERLGQQAVTDLIHKAVNALPPQPRKIYLLSRTENMNFDEIAEVTGLSRNTVKNHLQKALHDIRAYLVQQGYQPVIAAVLLKMLK